MSSTQLEVVKRMLRELCEISEEASLTGGFRGGSGHAVARYNALLREVVKAGLVPEGMFSPLNESTQDFGQLAVDSRLLLAAVSQKEDEDDDEDDHRGHEGHGEGGIGALIALAPFLDREDLSRLVKERLSTSGPIKDGMLIALAPFLDKSMLGEILNRRMRPGAPQTPKPPTPPEVPAAPEPPQVEEISAPVITSSRLPEVAPNEELAQLASRLADPNLTPDERSSIAIRLSELALHQGQIAREE